MITDSHCHLASHRFSAAEVREVIERAHQAGVTRIVTLATCLADGAANLETARLPGVSACLGIHPCDVTHAPDDAVRQLASFVDDPRVCGIGETGLDYYHPAPDGWNETAYRQRQLAFLRQHFELAGQARLPLVIHTRDRAGTDSFEDALAIYQEYHRQTRAVFHCYIGTLENARRVIALDGLVSIGGVATFKSARDLHETVKHLPAGTFMLETDAPYLAPEPHRGQRNEPAYTRITAERIAALRGESIAELAAHTTSSADSFFRFAER